MAVESTKFNARISRTLLNNGYATRPTSFTATNTNYTIKGNTNHPTVKSDFSNEYFTGDYYTKGDVLDYLA